MVRRVKTHDNMLHARPAQPYIIILLICISKTAHGLIPPTGTFRLGGRGYWTVYYTSPQSLIITFSYSFAKQLWVLLLNFDGSLR